MRSYMLLGKKFVSGNMYYEHICTNPDIKAIENKIKSLVISGIPVDNLKIVQDVPFEFKCAVKLLEEGESV